MIMTCGDLRKIQKDAGKPKRDGYWLTGWGWNTDKTLYPIWTKIPNPEIKADS